MIEMTHENQDKEMEAKAHRAQLILYGVMIFFAVLPFALWWLFLR
jgi:hypothetical protein